MFGGLTLSLIPSPATNKKSHRIREGVLPVLELISIETEAIVATARLVQPTNFYWIVSSTFRHNLSAAASPQGQDYRGASEHDCVRAQRKAEGGLRPTWRHMHELYLALFVKMVIQVILCDLRRKAAHVQAVSSVLAVSRSCWQPCFPSLRPFY